MSLPETPDFDEHPAPDPIGAARSESGAAGVEPAHTAPGEASGDVIGGYKLLQEIGEGGMGTVWMAQQAAPIQRKVALKIVKLGMDTREVVARFEAERQALAMMDHPHIAKVLDGGATDHGRPFFVMEMVRGTPITEYCDKAKLGLRERLELFMQVCGAVQHAHHKGIIHRDIKPSNVMVTLYDGVAVPKVIDFGIAKATCGELTHKTLFTRFEQVIGTPEYMSPEQAELSGLDIDTRADVYSLGVLLYELLTGTLPFDIGDALRVGYDELLRTIREVDPATPSTRVSTLGAMATPIAAKRHVEVGGLARTLRGDLDWIVMKSLEKDRARRYATPLEFADDIGRHLQNEPVVASPPSKSYRMRKFVRRNRLAVAAALAVTATLLVSTVALGWLYFRSVAAEERATRESETARQSLDFMIGMFEVADPEESRGGELTARQILESGAANIESELADQPIVQARLMSTIGNILERVGSFKESERLLRRAFAVQRELLGPEHEDTQQTTRHLINTLWREGRIQEANALELELLELHRATLGEDDPTILASYQAIARDYTVMGRYAEAEELLERSLARARATLGDEHEVTLEAVISMGYLRYRQGRLQEAEELYRQAWEVERRVHGEDARDTLTTKFVLAAILADLGQLDRAEVLTREVLEERIELLGADHDGTLMVFGRLAGFTAQRGRHEEAERLYRDLLEKRLAISGPDHPWTRAALHGLGCELTALGRHAEAFECLTRVLAQERRLEGPEHPETLDVRRSLVRLLLAEERYEDALTAVEEIRATLRRQGDRHVETGETLLLAGDVLLSLDRFDEAESTLAEGLTLLRTSLPEDHPDVAEARSRYGAALAGLDRPEEAEPILLEAHRALERGEAVDPRRIAESAERVAVFYAGRGDATEASTWRARARAQRPAGSDTD